MKKTVKLFFLFCFSAIILSACNKSDTPAQRSDHIVTKVDIACRWEQVRMERHYTDNQKMESVLLYLRLLNPQIAPDANPELPGRDLFEITVHLSNGKKRVYRQTGHRFFSADSRPWEMIDPKDASRLYILLQKLPGDSPAAAFSS